MTQDRELAIERRLSTVETKLQELEDKVDELRETVKQNAAYWKNLASSAAGGILVAIVTWWLSGK